MTRKSDKHIGSWALIKGGLSNTWGWPSSTPRRCSDKGKSAYCFHRGQTARPCSTDLIGSWVFKETLTQTLSTKFKEKISTWVWSPAQELLHAVGKAKKINKIKKLTCLRRSLGLLLYSGHCCGAGLIPGLELLCATGRAESKSKSTFNFWVYLKPFKAL